MLEDIKLKTDEQNQFLGDLFEGFLDDGVKQSEGQFFTPLPIVKFLVSSLPVKKILTETEDIPKAIDYACGAGHFLTEYASNVKDVVEKETKIPVGEYYKEIYGIEKEYRLSKVSKVSAFMYGQDDIQIIYGDALASNPNIKDGSFSVLIANPPYSVKGFLETLSEEDRERYSLSASVSDISKNNSIETFFVERAKQLLKGDGIAAIILPTSILSKNNIYVSCREIILKHFSIVAIAEFEAGTFGKTGTKTATLFLRRRKTNPDLSEHCKNRVSSWFDADQSKDIVFQDENVIDTYCVHCKINATEYKNWLSGGTIPSAEVFDKYRQKACESAGYKNIAKKKITSKYSSKQQDDDKENYINRFLKEIEKEKLYYFMLALNNNCKVVVTQSPRDKKEIKEFLGYDWSGAKGSEGIKYLGTVVEDEDDSISKNKGINSIKTPLFNPTNYYDENKINSIIRNNFEGKNLSIAEDLKDYVHVYNLVDMLDFTKVDFDKEIRTTVINEAAILSKYPLKKLGTLSKVKGGKRIPKGLGYANSITKHPYIRVSDFLENSIDISDLHYITDDVYEKIKNYTITDKDIYISIAGTIGLTGIIPSELNGANLTENAAKICNIDNAQINQEYLLYALQSPLVKRQITAATHKLGTPKLAITRIEELQIPVPPIDEQKDIVKKCKQLENEIIKCTDESKNLIDAEKNIIQKCSGTKIKLSEVISFAVKRINYASISSNAYITTDNLLQNYEGYKTYDGTPSVDKVIEYKPDDILISNIRPYLKKIWFADMDGGCSPDVFVIRSNDCKKLLPKYLYYMLRQDEFFDWIMTDVKGMKMPRGKKTTIEAYEIKIPSIKKQKEIVENMDLLESQRNTTNEKVKTLRLKKDETIEELMS